MNDKRQNLKNAKAAKRRERKKKMRRKRTFVLLTEIFILAILLGVGYVMAKYDKFQVVKFNDGDIKVNDGIKKEGYTTIALFGGDSREGELEAGTHADTIIIASINNKTKEIKMASVYRDTLTRQADGGLKKANNAYFVGGPKDAINLLNRNFDLDIEDYVTVDFKAMVDVIDALGGIEIDVQEVEVQYINKFLKETSKVAGVKSKQVTQAGPQILDGAQATTYARIRSTAGGDFKRTERQRLVLQKIFEKAKKSDMVTINGIIDKVFGQVSTSFELSEILTLASGAMDYKLGDTMGFPKENIAEKVQGLGSVVIPLGLEENVQELHKFLYPDEEYQGASDIVKEISMDIANRTGRTRADYQGKE